MTPDLTPATTACHLVAFFAALVAVASACSTEEPAPGTSNDMMDIADDAETSNGDSTSDADIDPCSGVTFESHAHTCSELYDRCPVDYPSCSGECSCRHRGDGSDGLIWLCWSHCEPEEDFFVPDGTRD